MLGKKTTVGLTVAAVGLALAVLFGVQAEKSTKCGPSEMHHSATTATERAYEDQANKYCSHPPADSLAVPAGLGVLVAVGGAAYAVISESRRRKLASAVAHRASLAYTGYQESRARQAQEREAQAIAEAEAKALAVPPAPAPAQEFAGAAAPQPAPLVYDYPAYAGESVPAPVEEPSPPPPAPAAAPAPSPTNDDNSDPFGGLFR